MSKQLNIDLRFNANTSAAKAQLQSLQTSLNQLTTGMAAQGTQLGITPQLQQAQQAAVQLKTALQQSMNVNTGKFDLSKFSSSLKLMNTDLSKLKTQLTSLGPSGQQAFMTLTQSIMTAEIPTKRISASLAALGTTLKNTAKWQISSMVLTGFINAIRTSYQYAQDLNESLNNIRIVTGESTEAMDKFAARANKAAKALSASTLDYTNAALIFYQQGLTGQAVEDRTDVVIKMANVTKQTAEVVSDQMTAIWNNFYDGSKSLEYYADVLTALGAATASSTDEIAGGLEKFAAVGQTIGLSYEYAASALATITANTRQSEEVVGTALKTIFARIQGLKLGETLEDGTTLNKYSEALATVEVDIFDANRQLKGMNTILDETAAKWKTLDRDQQAALAQSVAGIRQYTQFVALMDNWDDGTTDSMVANLETVANSTGELQEQADLYAESWEAANKRVKAAAEELYTALLVDDFFIDLTDGFAVFLGLVDNFIDSMGGVKGLLSGLASMLLYAFSGPAAKALESMVYNFKSFIGLTQKEAVAFQTSAGMLASGMTPILADSSVNSATMMGSQQQVELNHTLLNLKQGLNEQERFIAQNIIDQNNQYAEQIVLLGQAKDMAMQEQQAAKTGLKDTMIADVGMKAPEVQGLIQTMDTDLNLGARIKQEMMEIDQALEKGKIDLEEYKEALRNMEAQASAGGLSNTAQYIESRYTRSTSKEAVKSMSKETDDMMDIHTRTDAVRKFKTGAGDNGTNIDSKAIDNYAKSTQKAINSTELFAKGQKNLRMNTEQAKKQLLGLGNSTQSWSQTVVGAAQGMMSLSFAINSFKSIGSTWADETIGTGEKLLQTFMSLGMAIPMLINGLKGLKSTLMGSATVQNTMLLLQQQDLMLQGQKITGLTAEQLAEKSGMTIEQTKQALITSGMALRLQELGLTQSKIITMTAEQLAEKTGMTTKQAGIVISSLKSGATLKEALAEAGLTSAKGIGTLATIAATVANWGFLASMSPLLAITLVLVVAIAGLALIVWGLVAAVKNFIANSPEGKLKAAQEASAALSEELNKTKEAADALKQAFEDYKTIQSELAECKKGTEEWNEALRKNNDKVRELIDLYPKLRTMSRDNEDGTKESAVGINEQGELVIADWAQEELIVEANARVASATIADSLGKQRVREQKIENQQQEVDENSLLVTRVVVSGDAGDDEIIKKIEDLEEKGYTETSSSTYQGTKQVTLDNKVLSKQFIEDLINKYGKEASKHVSEIEGLSEHQQETLKSVIDSELALRGAIEENTIATLLEKQGNVDNIMSGYENYDKRTDEDKALIRSVIGQTSSKAEESEGPVTVKAPTGMFYWGGEENGDGTVTFDSKEDLEAQYTEVIEDKAGWTSNASERAKMLFDQYLIEQGLDPTKLTSLERTDTGFKYQMEGQEEQTIAFTSIVDAMMSKLEQGEIRDYGEVITDQMASFENQQQKELFAAGVTGDGSLLSDDLLKQDQEAINEYVDSMEIAAETLEELGGISEEEFKQQIKDIAKSKKAFDSFAKSYQSNMDRIAAGGDNATQAAQNIANDLEEVFNTSVSLDNIVTPEFIEDNKQLFDDFFNGVEGSAERMRKAIGEQIWIKAGLDATEFETAYDDLNSKILEAKGMGLQDLEFGATLDDAQVLASLTDMMNGFIEAGMTAAQAGKAIVDSLGIDVEFEKDENKEITPQNYVNAVPEEVPLETEAINPATGKPTTMKYSGVRFKLETATQEGSSTTSAIGVKVKNAKYVGGGDINKKKTTTTSTVKPPTTKGGGGGGGGSKPKKAKKLDPTEKKRTIEEVERYKEITTAIEDMNTQLEITKTLKDAAWGPEKIKYMKQENEQMKQALVLSKEYERQVKTNLELDKQEVEKYGAIFDPITGRITNYEDLQEQWTNEWNAQAAIFDEIDQNLEDRMTAAENANDEDEKEKIQEEQEQAKKDREEYDKEYDLKRESIERYTDTLSDYNQAIADNLAQEIEIKEQNYEMIMYEVEFKVEIDDSKLERLDYYMSKYEGNFYKSAEALALFGDKIEPITNILQVNYNLVDKLQEEYANGQITAESYMEGLQEAQSAIIDNLSELQAQMKEVGEYYLDVLSEVSERIDTQMSKFDKFLNRLEHFSNLTKILYGEEAYDMLDKIYDGQSKVLNNRIKATEKEIEMLNGQKDEIQEELNKSGISQETKEKLQRDFDEVETMIAEKQESLIADIEQLAEIALAILNNTLGAARKAFEEALSGEWGDIDSIIQKIERLNSSQEEYLTTTNKLYETNKLINQSQMDLEKTDNARAKQQLQDYIKYVEQLQQAGKLSQFELEMAQADYEILQKKIALEEAQQAKNQVRLTRDSEGNYGYVYTANQNNIDKAAQELADAQNAKYNASLEAAKEYQDKYYQAEAEMLEALEELDELYANRLISKEEWEKRRAEIVDHYLTEAATYEELYYKATGAMLEESAENRIDYTLMGVGSLEELTEATKVLMKEQEEAFDEYDENLDIVAEHSAENFGSIEQGIKNTTKEAKNLSKEIIQKLIPTLEDELNDVLIESMKTWYNLERSIASAREEAERMLETIGKIIEALGQEFSLDTTSNTTASGIIDEIYENVEKENFGSETMEPLLDKWWENGGNQDTTNYASLADETKDPIWKAVYWMLAGEQAERKGKTSSNTTNSSTVKEEVPSQEEKTDSKPELTVGSSVQIKANQKWYQEASGNGKSGSSNSVIEDTITKIEEGAKYPYHIRSRGWVAKSSIVGYDTGGYTGAWGPEGKLAILHEKELILNKEDTSNFLSGIDILREVSQNLDANALLATLGLFNLSAMSINSNADQVLQQEVTIHADFPNVTDHNEIELAIDNLINAASQYAYR